MALSHLLTAGLIMSLSWIACTEATKKTAQAKKPEMTILFKVPFGESPGQFHFEPSPLGPELDAYPRDFVRDSGGNFIFLEPAPAARLTKYSPSGKFLWAFPLSDRLPDSMAEREVSPHQVFTFGDGSAVLVSAMAHAARIETYVAYFDAAGSLKRLVPLQGFDAKYFEEGGTSELDGAGYLLAMRPGGTTEVYAHDGRRQHTIDRLVSYVDPTGLLFTATEPVGILNRDGSAGEQITFKGGEAPEMIGGGNGHGLVWAVQHAEEQSQNGRLIDPWSLEVFRFSALPPSADFVRTIELPPSEFQALDPAQSMIRREQVYGPKIIMDDHGAVYVMGRSERECWIVKIAQPPEQSDLL